jgi:hypothetical protein
MVEQSENQPAPSLPLVGLGEVRNHLQRKVRVRATVLHIDQDALLVPRHVIARCDPGDTPTCRACRVGQGGGRLSQTIPPDDPVLLELMRASPRAVPALLRRQLGIPATCRSVTIDQISEYDMRRVTLMPPTPTVPNVDRRAPTDITCNGVLVSLSDVRRSKNYEFTAIPRSNCPALPILQITNMRAITVRDHFLSMTQDDVIESLRAFQPSAGQSVIDKLREIREDITSNAVEIQGLDRILAVLSLTFHSIPAFKFKEELLSGMLKSLIVSDIGDRVQAAIRRLREHYGLGDIVHGVHATERNLWGGSPGRGHSHPGGYEILSYNNRGLLIIEGADRVKGKDTLRRLVDILSDGSFSSETRHCEDRGKRVRLVLLAYPTRPLNRFSVREYEVLWDVLKWPKSVHQCDLGLIDPGSKNVDPRHRILEPRPAKIPPRFTPQLCNLLLRWVWSLEPEHVQFEDGFEDIVRHETDRLVSQYKALGPLFHPFTTDFKVARIAAAIAAATFSSPDGVGLVVGRKHVEAAVETLNWLYGKRGT